MQVLSEKISQVQKRIFGSCQPASPNWAIRGNQFPGSTGNKPHPLQPLKNDPSQQYPVWAKTLVIPLDPSEVP